MDPMVPSAGCLLRKGTSAFHEVVMISHMKRLSFKDANASCGARSHDGPQPCYHRGTVGSFTHVYMSINHQSFLMVQGNQHVQINTSTQQAFVKT
jgi:hypothetical protein